jgi:hypothetical protein
MGYLQTLNATPTGAPYTAYYNLEMQNMDVEMGFPVVHLLPGKEEIKAREIPAGRAVVTMYKGAYSGMEGTYNEIQMARRKGLPADRRFLRILLQFATRSAGKRTPNAHRNSH